MERGTPGVIVSGHGPERDPDLGCSLIDYWTAEPLGRWHLAFTNPGPGDLWIHAVYRGDVLISYIDVRPGVRVSSGRTVVFDMRSMIRVAEWPVIDPEYTYRYLPEYDISLAYVAGQWWVTQPPGAGRVTV